jgi:hypothetical protein
VGLNRLLRNPYGAIIFGLLCLLVGFIGTSSDVKCHGAPMTPEQTCTQEIKGKVVTLTYDQQRGSDQMFMWVLYSGGAAMIIGGATGLVLRARRARSAPLSARSRH